MINQDNFPNDILSARNLKATATRVEVLHSINDFNGAMPFSRLQKTLTQTDRVTLYRTIQTLLEKGIIHKAFNTNNEIYYALCGSNCSEHVHNHNHVHFKCSNCQKVSCEYLKDEITISLPNFKIDHVQINLTGICTKCFV